MNRNECIFCRIADGDLPATVVHEDEHAVAFRDLDPKAPTHLLVIPRRHIGSAADLTDADADLAGHLLVVAAEVARSEGVEDSGYRLVTNIGSDGGQSVPHLHVHLLGGRTMTWPPG
jgi:histidine triad (HIT) family protein